MFGAAAVNHVAEELKRDHDTYKDQLLMVARAAPEKQLNLETVPKIPALVNIAKFHNTKIDSAFIFIRLRYMMLL